MFKRSVHLFIKERRKRRLQPSDIDKKRFLRLSMASYTSHTSIMNLNDDCLLEIFQYLTENEQLFIGLTCSRFQELIDVLKYKDICFMNTFDEHKDCTDGRIARASKTARILIVKLNVDLWEILQQYTFQQVILLECSQEEPFLMDDDCMLKMTKMFPKLCVYSPDGPFSGKYVQNFLNLESIDLGLCDNLEFGHLETIFEKLHLKSVDFNVFDQYYEWTSERAFKNFCDLERIYVNFFELPWLSNLSKFTNLKEITIADHEFPNNFRVQEFLESFDKYKSEDLQRLETKLKFPFQGSKTREFIHLETLALSKQSISKYIDIRSYAPNLRILQFADCYIPTSKDLSFLLIHNEKVACLSIGLCRCGFREFTINVKDITQHRTKPLHFYFYRNYFYDIDLNERVQVKVNVEDSSSLLDISENLSFPIFDPALRIQLR